MGNLRRDVVANTVSDSCHQTSLDAGVGEHFMNHKARRGFAVSTGYADNAHFARWIAGFGSGNGGCQ